MKNIIDREPYQVEFKNGGLTVMQGEQLKKLLMSQSEIYKEYNRILPNFIVQYGRTSI